MNLPNLLTTIRILLVPVFLLAFLTRYKALGLLAAFIFVVAAITDGVDGYLARKHNAVTKLGKFLDPLADKLLITAALIGLVEVKLISTWVAMVIIGRELAVTGLRGIAAAEGTVIAAGPWGKAKTVVQIIFIVTAMLHRSLPEGLWLHTLADFLFQPLLWAAVALTLWSGIDYFQAYYRGLGAARPRTPLKFRLKLPLRRRPSKP
ncbi:MAG TPA: CDP-diacylglycerol--glycerol-3-phosphate 3-phosphatidyltransferase [Symbiobacteriaceae bacterium]|nr:CDP-diacylglycerol--glycerol-3-phosphate 3-phosphatidyltransferase [Symbiobacteriaceae bacterium]